MNIQTRAIGNAEAVRAIDVSEAQVKKILFQILAYDTESDIGSIKEESTLQSLGVDSFTYVQMVIQLEETFNIVIKDEWQSAKPIRTVADVIALIRASITPTSLQG